jgi:pyruvate formate lyase activating enzyme
MQIDRQRCDVCGLCVEACPAAALEIIGLEQCAEDVLAELVKDTAFYQSSNGGVTLSGGEPLMQPEFAEALSRMCQNRGLHVALDTCGAVAWDRFERILPLVDLVLYDLKLFDPAQHRASTGVDNTLILDNVRRVAAVGIPLWIRTPIIPGHTADTNNIAALGDFIATELPTVQRWDLLAYTNLGQSKYQRLGRAYALEGVPLCTKSEMTALHRVAMQRVPVAVWSGATSAV